MALVACVFLGCANMQPMDGGLKDIKPPEIVSIFPENKSVFFKGNTITITFDEYVQLNDLINELVVSPPLERTPIASVRKKTLSIELQESLEPNTTYTFNFGNAIADINEGNKLDFVYVVSTGSYIDSLSIVGTTKDAWTKEPIDGVRLMLYKSSEDSVVLQKTPAYFAKASKNGTFQLDYLSSGEYTLVALEDKNFNYRLDSDERVAFLDTTVSAGLNDSLLQKQNLFLALSMPDKPLFTDYKVDSLGNLALAWDKRFSAPDVFFEEGDSLGLPSKWNATNDSLTYCILSAAPNKEHRMIVAWQDSTLDTLAIPFFNEALDLNFEVKSTLVKKHMPTRPLPLQGKPNVRVKDSSAVLLVCDSVAVPATLTADSAVAGRFLLESQWKAGKKYSATLLPGVFENAGKGTNDTLKIEFQTYAVEDFGTLILEWSAETIRENDVFVLTNSKLNEIIKLDLTEGQTSLVINNLEPLEYRMFIWNDANSNGIWDAGSFLKKIQPEKSWAFNGVVNVRANWEIRQKWEMANE